MESRSSGLEGNCLGLKFQKGFDQWHQLDHVGSLTSQHFWNLLQCRLSYFCGWIFLELNILLAWSKLTPGNRVIPCYSRNTLSCCFFSAPPNKCAATPLWSRFRHAKRRDLANTANVLEIDSSVCETVNQVKQLLTAVHPLYSQSNICTYVTELLSLHRIANGEVCGANSFPGIRWYEMATTR